VCAAREEATENVLTGRPELRLSGLARGDARALLADDLQGPLDPAVRDQIVAESHGNPLALLELPRTWNVADLAANPASMGHRRAGQLHAPARALVGLSVGE
jgi:hypothetical protein